MRLRAQNRAEGVSGGAVKNSYVKSGAVVCLVSCLSKMTERVSVVITIREAAVKITKIDHIHVYVESIELAERWYQEVLGFSRDDSLYFWFEQGGPLVIRNHGASLSLFPRKNQHPGHTVALAVEAAEFLSFVFALKAKSIPFTVCDHDVSMSVYFNDLSDNKIELTSYEYLQAKQLLHSVLQ